MNDTPSSQKILAEIRKHLPTVDQFAELIAKLPRDYREKIREDFTERPVVRKFKINDKRK